MSIVTKREVSQFIRTIDDRKELMELWEEMKEQNNRISRMAAASFAAGDKVSFKGKRGHIISGKVLSAGPKNIKVRDNETGVRWTVTASLVSLEN